MISANTQDKDFLKFIRRHTKSYQTQEIKREIVHILKSLAKCDMTRIHFSEPIRQIRITIEHDEENGKIWLLVEDFIFKFRNSCQHGFATEEEIRGLQDLDHLNHRLKKYCH